jgi:TRAP transporter TAXI family solute receptor
MKKHRTISLLLGIFLLGLLIASGPAMAGKPMIVAFGSGGTGGTYYVMGAAIAEIMTKDVAGIKTATSQVTAASYENVRLIQKNYVQFCLNNAASTYDGWNGLKPFKGKMDKLRTIAWGHGSDYHVVVLEKSAIKKFGDAKGKRMSVGAPGSGMEMQTRRLLGVMGLSYDDFKTEFLSISEAVGGLKDGRIDVVAMTSGMPGAALIDLANVRPMRLISLEKQLIKDMLKAHPYYEPMIIPAGTYKGVDYDVQTLTSPAVFSCRADVPEEVVYEVIKAIDKKIPWLAKNVHRGFNRWRFEPSVKRLAPLHPGAIKYYKEMGKM